MGTRRQDILITTHHRNCGRTRIFDADHHGRSPGRRAAKVKATPTTAEPAVSPAPAEVAPDLLVPATCPDVKWQELRAVVFSLHSLTTAVRRSERTKLRDRGPEQVREHVQELAGISRRLEAVAAAQAARASPA